jgi:hypothetical protein
VGALPVREEVLHAGPERAVPGVLTWQRIHDAYQPGSASPYTADEWRRFDEDCFAFAERIDRRGW